MADILLSFGLKHDAALDENLSSQLSAAIAKVEGSAPKIKVGVTIDPASLTTFKSQLTRIVNSVTTGTGKKITLNIDGLGNITADAEKAAGAVKKIGNAAEGAANDVKGVGVAADVAENKISKAFQIKTLDQLDKKIEKLRKNLKNWSEAGNAEETADAYSELTDALNAYIEKRKEVANTPLFEEGELVNDKHELDIMSKTSYIDEKVSKSTRTIKDAGKATKSWGDRVGSLTEKFATWLTVSQVVMQIYTAMKRMVTTAVEVDTAMTELKKVTNETDATYDKFLDNAETRAKEVGATLTDAVNASASFARLGYDIDEAANLADTAIVYKNVADDIDSIDDASSSIISTMQAFGVEAEDAMSIVDKFNEVSNNFAITSGGLGEAMQRSAAAMNASNNTLDQTIALITAANTVVQNPESVGTTLKTVSMYLRAAKTEAEEAGESTEGMAESTSELRKEILALTGDKVDIQLDEDTFKSTYQILKELSEVWNELTDVSQANILEMIGGKRNANVVSALLENFSVAEEVLKTSEDSAGSAIAENEKYLESIEGHISKFKASFEALSETAIDSDIVKDIVDLGTGFLDAANAVFTLVDALGGLDSALAIFATYKGINFIGDIANGDLKIDDIIKSIQKAKDLPVIGKTFDFVGNIFKNTKSGFTDIGTGISKVAEEAAKGTGIVGKFQNGLGALTTLFGPTKIGLAGLAIGVTAVTTAYNLYKKAEEERLSNAKEDIELFKEQSSTLNDYKTEVTSLKESLEYGNLSSEESYNARSRLLEIQNEIVANYGIEASALNLLAASADEASAAIDGVTESFAKQYLTENAKVIDEATKRMTQVKSYESGAFTVDVKALNALEEVIAEYDNVSLGGNITDGFFLSVSGNADEARETVSELREEFQKLDKQFNMQGINSGMDEVVDGLSTIYNKVQKYVSDYEDIYKEAIQMEIASGYGYSISDPKQAVTYNSILKKLTDAQLEYDKAVSGSFESTEHQVLAYKHGLEEMANAIAFFNDVQIDEPAVKEYFDNLIEEWQADMDEKQLFIDIVARFDDGDFISDSEYRPAILKFENLLRYGILDVFKDNSGLVDGFQILSEAINIESLDGTTSELNNTQLAIKGLSDACNASGIELEDFLYNLSKAGVISSSMADSISAATDAYSQWKTAQDAEESGAMYDDMKKALDQIKEGLKTGKVGTAKFKASVELLVPDTIDQNGVKKYMTKLNRYLTDNKTGVTNFVRDAISKGLFEGSLSSFKSKAGLTIDEICEELEITPEMAKAIFKELKEYDIKVEFDPVDFDVETLKDALEKAKEEIEKIKLTPNADTSALDDLSERITGVLTQIKELQDDGITYSGNKYAYADVKEEIEEILGDSIKLGIDIEDLGISDDLLQSLDITVPVDTEDAMAQLAEVSNNLEYVGKMADEVASKDIGKLGADKANTELDRTFKLLKDIDNYKVEPKQIVEDSGGGSPPSSTGEDGFSGARGIVDAKGGKTLVGELGPELVSSEGRYYTVGNDGAEFVNLKPGDIVFNNRDTEEIFNRTSQKKTGQAFGGGSGDSVDIEGGFIFGGSTAGQKFDPEAFEKKLKDYQHALEMGWINMETYINWLSEAYKVAYENSKKDEEALADYRKYEEEVYKGRQDIFKDSLEDKEHLISMLVADDAEASTVINNYQTLINAVEKELARAYASGLDDNDDYIQELQDKLIDYKDEIKSINDEITEDVKDSYEDLIEYRKDMLKQELEDEKDELNERISTLRDFYSYEKDMLQGIYDEDKYQEDQAEKNKAVSDIKAEIEMLKRDDSASAQRRILELQEELAEAEKELKDFENDHAFEKVQDALDKELEAKEKIINADIDLIDKELEDEKGLREQAIADLQNGDFELYEEMLKYNATHGDGNDNTVAKMWEDAYIAMKAYFELYGQYYEGMQLENVTGYVPLPVGTGYAGGTSSATAGIHEIEEDGAEYIFESSNGRRYRMFTGDEKVLNAASTDFLYRFANSGGKVLENMVSGAKSPIPSGIVSNNQTYEINTGDIIIQGNATEKTVSEIRRAQRDNVEFILKEFSRLQNK